MIDCSKVKELIGLINDISIKDNEASKIKTFYGDVANNLATSLMNRGLFLEHLPLLAEISRDCLRIYSYIPNKSKHDQFNRPPEGIFNEVLIRLYKAQPMKSYLRLSFRQVQDFILTKNTGTKLRDMPHLMSYLNDLRNAFETLCAEDQSTLKMTTRSGLTVGNILTEAISDASFLISWTLIEGIKYCIEHRFAPEMSAIRFRALLQSEISSPVTISDKITKRFLINFFQILDKFIQDRVLESSTGKHTFNASHEVELFWKSQVPIFKSWFLKIRQVLGELSLIVDDPAECWRNASLKLYVDYTTKYRGSSSEMSLSQTLMSLNHENWYTNISLLALSAKQLEDISLLYGIRTLSDNRGIICKYPPLDVIIANSEHHYEQTYNLTKGSKDLDQQCLIEYLDACNELNELETNQDYIEKLESESLRQNYKIYIESKIQSKIPNTRRAEVEQWLTTWSEVYDSKVVKQPIRCHIDMVVPTYLNIIVRSPIDERPKLVERAEWLISQDFICQSLFPPCYINKNIKVYDVILDLLKGRRDIDQNLLETHAKDLYWNHTLYRHLNDLDMVGNLRKESSKIDLIQLRAAKHNARKGNKLQASKIAQDLVSNATIAEVKIRSSLIIMPGDPTDHLKHISSQIEELVEKKCIKTELRLKIIRQILRLPFKSDADELQFINNIDAMDEGDVIGDASLESWQYLQDMSFSVSKAKTLSVLSERFNERSQKPDCDVKLLNQTVKLDLKLLMNLCQSQLCKHKATALECATRILQQVVKNHSRLNLDNLNQFRSEDFIESTKNIWILVKTNLISIISYSDSLSQDWRAALIKIVKSIGQTYPNLLVYSIIVNRLDLQNELVYLNDESASGIHEPHSILLHDNSTPDTLEPGGKLRECKRKLDFWNELFDYIKGNNQVENRWHEVVTETERFLKEIRKISFLCGEYLKTLTLKFPKRLYNFVEHFKRSCDTKSGIVLDHHRQEECHKRLKAICDQASNSIKTLLYYRTKIGETNLSKYDIWFCETFSKHLRELDYRLNLLARKKPLILDEMTMLIKSITELLAVCRSILLDYNQLSRQKLYMEMISPTLSRLEPSLIPMPDCCYEPTNSKKSQIFIHKISQTVNLIVSKTSPKKLRFIGSDGQSRSFLLKAHEDLRLDQLIMELFASINNLFLRNEETRNKFRLRRYSVTPVSTRSGLIQWIEAPSLCSSYRAWLNGPNGKKVTEQLYSTTCTALCGDQSAKSKVYHINCQPPQSNQSTEIFYQLLWAKTKSSRIPLTQTKPFFGNIVKYRAEFDKSVFQSIVEQLLSKMPRDLLANQLWYMSNNSHSYWFKTQEFIRSCAAMSIVGYIIGLGDRHPENILLDHSTGEVIHIDYNICFELGKTLPIPEQVPFRLTHNMIHAFGFAGLEGNFTIACRNVMKVLKDSRLSLLYLLDPVNLKFMVGQPTKTDDTKEQTTRSHTQRPSVDAKLAPTSFRNLEPIKSRLEMDMCSQESVELKPVSRREVTDPLVPNLSPLQEASTSNHAKTIMKSLVHHSYDFQHNIKTPTKIVEKAAANIFERCRDKLNGTDECIRNHNNYHLGSYERHDKQPSDLIVLNTAMSTEDQVDSLILEATSIENKSAMFEGWIPWL